jgi:hypothetical protein
MTLLDLPPAALPPDGYAPASIVWAFATDINNRGEIVGYIVYKYLALHPVPDSQFVTVSRGPHWAPDGHVIDVDDVIPAYAGSRR